MVDGLMIRILTTEEAGLEKMLSTEL